MSDKKTEVKEKKAKPAVEKTESLEFTGKYVKAIGRRKTSVAQVRLYTEDGKGTVVANGMKISKYVGNDLAAVAQQAMKATGHVRDCNISLIVKGGGVIGQVEAMRHGIARAILAFDPESREVLRTSGFLTRDPRAKERKKPGLKAARKAPQWSKR
jgi:small subunit ribosomal protein S9